LFGEALDSYPTLSLIFGDRFGCVSDQIEEGLAQHAIVGEDL